MKKKKTLRMGSIFLKLSSNPFYFPLNLKKKKKKKKTHTHTHTK